ncbi:probable polyol transporter 6 [Punica granatum]|uniref:Major facilitator superfamily (MFS) profile domain-containing protein n=2 Tax=Punica granatum TaxID=22663 RepID=A0A218W0U0_PUNGR|nr:probable polyol transporter 6 [Punica granatum]OWM66365.1 hypothetical protein CDL15_Pgr013582 [Punica granatum]PKI78570.1 hypothetical protein CRG98_001042 [Punica granatum]
MVSVEEGAGGKPRGGGFKYACACAIVASMINIIFGYDTGVISGALIFIKKDLLIGDTQVEVLAGILNLCALVGTLVAGRISDYIGRRYTIVLASLIFMVGSVLMGWAPNYGVLMAGRCTAGISVGFALMIAPVYISEVAAPSARGMLTGISEVCISVGILSGYVSNLVFARMALRLGWRLMLGIAAAPSLMLALGILQMPESPRWLVLQGRLRDAKAILRKVSSSDEEADVRFRDILAAAGINPDCTDDYIDIPDNVSSGKGVWKELLIKPTPSVRWVLLAALGIHFFEHATGIQAVILYSPRIFKKAGVTSQKKLLLATVGVGLTKLTFVFLSTLLMDRVGRRKLLLGSTVGIIVSLSGLGLCLTIVEHSKEKLLWALVLSIVATYAFVALMSFGLGPVTWVYSTEIFPLRLRAQGMAIGVAVNRFMNAAVSMSFLSISHTITIGGSFFMFAGIAVVALIFFYFFLPETKEKSLEEIEMMFGRESQPKPKPKPKDSNAGNQ